MPTIVQAVVGESRGGPESIVDLRTGPDVDLIVSQLHGKYFEQTRNSRTFSALQTAGVACITAGGTTSSFCLANPANSGVVLSLIRFAMGITTAPGTSTLGLYGLYVNNNVNAAAITGTAIVPICNLVGSPATGNGKPFTTATLPVAPTLFKLVGQRYAVYSTTGLPTPVLDLDFDGNCVLFPGTSICLQQVTADTTSNASVLCGITYEESRVATP